MNRSTLLLSLSLLAGGCSSAVAPLGRAPLDRPATVSANGAEKQSEVTMYRVGVLDPRGGLQTLAVEDASLRLSTSEQQAVVEELVIKLADTDFSPTEAMPDGIKLRNQELRLTAPVQGASMPERNVDAVTVHAHTNFVYRASMVLSDGSLYQLGAVEGEPVDFDVRATRYFGFVHVTIDAAPQGKCWSVPGIIEVSDCSLYVETDGDAYAR
jgi:hypothetical protein